MPKGPKGEKRPADVIGAAIKVAKIATGEIEEEAKPNDGKKSHTPEIQTETVPRNVRFTPKSGHSGVSAGPSWEDNQKSWDDAIADAKALYIGWTRCRDPDWTDINS